MVTSPVIYLNTTMTLNCWSNTAEVSSNSRVDKTGFSVTPDKIWYIMKIYRTVRRYCYSTVQWQYVLKVQPLIARFLALTVTQYSTYECTVLYVYCTQCTVVNSFYCTIMYICTASRRSWNLSFMFDPWLKSN